MPVVHEIGVIVGNYRDQQEEKRCSYYTSTVMSEVIFYWFPSDNGATLRHLSRQSRDLRHTRGQSRDC